MTEVLYLNTDKKITDDLLKRIKNMQEKSNIDTHSEEKYLYENKFVYNGNKFEFKYIGKCEHWEGENYIFDSTFIPFADTLFSIEFDLGRKKLQEQYKYHFLYCETVKNICKLLLENGYKVKLCNNDISNPTSIKKHSTLKMDNLKGSAVINTAELCELLP